MSGASVEAGALEKLLVVDEVGFNALMLLHPDRPIVPGVPQRDMQIDIALHQPVLFTIDLLVERNHTDRLHALFYQGMRQSRANIS